MHAPGHPPLAAHTKRITNANQIQARCKPNPSPMQTKCKPNEPSCKSTANQVQTKRTILQINCKPSACATVRLEGVQDAHPYQSSPITMQQTRAIPSSKGGYFAFF